MNTETTDAQAPTLREAAEAALRILRGYVPGGGATGIIKDAGRELAAALRSPETQPGTPAARLDWLDAEVEKRNLPENEPYSSGRGGRPEWVIVAAYDRLAAEVQRLRSPETQEREVVAWRIEGRSGAGSPYVWFTEDAKKAARASVQPQLWTVTPLHAAAPHQGDKEVQDG